MESLFYDVRYAFRLWLKSPGFAAVAILTLALGIGATTTMFSVIDAVLLESAPVRNPQRLVMVWESKFNGNAANKTNVVGPANYLRWIEQNHSFEDMGAFIALDMNASVNGHPERVQAGIATPSLFSTLGARAALGRVFLPEEQEPGKDNVALLSYSYWQQRFGGDPAAVGRDVELNGSVDKIVGVLPPNFDLLQKVSIWTTLTVRPQSRQPGGRYLTVIGRLRPGVTEKQAQADMDVVASRIRAELPDWDAGWGVTLVPFREQLIGGLRTALWVLLGAVAFVLLIACANVANLMMAKASSRHKEIAIRAALGSSRARLVGQLLTESTGLSLAGGLLGIALSFWAIQAVIAIAPTAFPGYVNIRLNVSVLAFTFAVSVVTGILFGIIPALRAAHTDPQEALKEGGKGSPARGPRHAPMLRVLGWSHGRQRARNVLVVVEAATALILLVGAGILMRSFVRLLNVNTGFQPQHVLTMEVSLSGAAYRKEASVAHYFQEAVTRVQRVHGVTAAGAISYLPLAGLGSATSFTLDDRPAPKPGEEPVADVRTITSDYFRAMGIPLLRGRAFDAGVDHPDDPVKKIIVNQATVDKYWPGQNPIGKTIHMQWNTMLHAEVIGVVPNIRSAKVEATSFKPMLYWYVPQFANGSMTIVARASGDPESLIPDVKAAVASVDSSIPVANIRTMDDVVGDAIRQPRFTAVLLAIFAVLALILAAIGLYGVISYSVTQRQHELGIRMALGARPEEVTAMIVREGLGLTLTGASIGFVAALVLVRFLSTLVFDVSIYDALVFGTVPLIIAAVAALACYLPARRATRVDPMVALHYE